MSFRFWRVFCLTGQLGAAVSAMSVARAQPAAVRDPPAVQIFPHAGVIGQPRRVPPQDNHSLSRHQGKWGDFAWGDGEAAGFGPVGRYGIAPWAEDWEYLRDPSLRRDPLDVLKFIALNDRKTLWLSLSGETRLRNWYESRPYLGKVGPAGSGRFAVRNLYGADLHIGGHVRFFGQIVNGEAAGWGGYGYGPTWRKKLDAQQIFVELKASLAGAKTGLIVGRQQFLDAPSWLLYDRETPNVPLSWNGARLYALWRSIRVDLYDFVQTDTRSERIFGDGEDYGTRLYGADVTKVLPMVSLGGQNLHSFMDVFWMGFRFGGASAQLAQGDGVLSGSQQRQNIGFRLYGSARSFEYELSGDYQSGTFHQAGSGATRPISAYAAKAVLGYRRPASFLHPFIGAQVDLYSGGRADRDRGTIGGFVLPFNPQTNSLDTTTYFARANLIALSPIVSLAPLSFLSVQVKAPLLWRQTVRDPLFSPFGRYAFGPLPSLSAVGRRVGLVPQGSVLIQMTQHLSWRLYGAYVVLTKQMRHIGAREGGYLQSNVVFRF